MSFLFCIQKALFGSPSYEELLKKLPQETYQNVIINGKIIKSGVKDHKTLEGLINDLASKYERPFTMLDLRGEQGYFCLKTASKYKCSAIMIEGRKNNCLPEICGLNNQLDNLIVLEKFLTPLDLKMLGKCEHFDIVLAPNIIHHFKDDWQEATEYILTLGDYIFIETPPSDCYTVSNKQNLADIEDYLRNHPSGKIIGQTPRYGNPAQTGPNQKFSNIYLFSMRKNILQKPFWNASINRYYTIVSNFKNKLLLKPRYDNELIPWKSGINLWTFTKLNGVYPTKQMLKEEIKKQFSAYSHADFTPWNMLIQGNKIEFINKPNETFIATNDSYERCLQILGLI